MEKRGVERGEGRQLLIELRIVAVRDSYFSQGVASVGRLSNEKSDSESLKTFHFSEGTRR